MVAVDATVFSLNMQKFVLFLSLLCFPLYATAEFIVQYPYRDCSNATFSPNSTFLSNLHTLSPALSSNASHHLYHNASVGSRTSGPTVYGHFQCRGDTNASTCRICVSTAASNSSQQFCPLSAEVVIWFDECLLRYSNTSFFSVLSKDPGVGLINPDAIDQEDVDRFNQLVNSTLTSAATRAVNSSKEALMFATMEVGFKNETIYTLAQCTGDLSKSSCGECLADAVANVPLGKKGARFLHPSCTVRYELYAFYNDVKLSSPAPAPTPVPSPSVPDAPGGPVSPPAVPSSSGSSLAPSAAVGLLSGKGSRVAMAMGIIVASFLS